MTTFQYIAKDNDGQELCGKIEAEDRSSALAAIRDQGLIPLAIGEVRGGGSSGRAKRTKKRSDWGAGALLLSIWGYFLLGSVWFIEWGLVLSMGVSSLALVLGIIGICDAITKRRVVAFLYSVLSIIVFCFYYRIVREIKKGVRESDDVLNAVDKGMKIDKRVKSTDEDSKGFDFGSVVHLSGKAVREVDVDKVMDVAGKVAKELDMDKVMKVADEGIQVVDRIARSLNDGNGAQGTAAPLSKEQIKEKIQKWQNDRWKVVGNCTASGRPRQVRLLPLPSRRRLPM